MLVATGKDTLVRLLQPQNATSFILLALGKDTSVTSVRLLQEANALLPMLVATGKDTLVRLLQSWNAP